MKTCSDCGKVYADKYDACPNCKSKKAGKGCLIAIGLILGVGLIGSLLSKSDKSGSSDSASPSAQTESSNVDFNTCVNRLIRTNQYSSFDGGKSALSIMMACKESLTKIKPECFADDPKDNEIDNQKQMSPGANCRFAAVAAIQLSLKAHEGGIPLSDESSPGVEKKPGSPPTTVADPAPTPPSKEPEAAPSASPAPETTAGQGDESSTTADATSANQNGPSFDCARVKSEVLNMVCQTSALSSADLELSSSYKAALARSATPDELVRSQRQWIQDRNNSTANAPFLLRMYQSRIDYLNNR